MADPKTGEVGKIQQLIIKNPTAFVAAVFFFMFWVTYFINIRKNDHAEQYWKELYLKEKKEKDRLKDELLIKAGVVERQKAASEEADNKLRQETMEPVQEILNLAK